MSNGRFVIVTGSDGLRRFIVVCRPVMRASFGALNMSARIWMFCPCGRRMLRAIAMSSTLEKQPCR